MRADIFFRAGMISETLHNDALAGIGLGFCRSHLCAVAVLLTGGHHHAGARLQPNARFLCEGSAADGIASTSSKLYTFAAEFVEHVLRDALGLRLAKQSAHPPLQPGLCYRRTTATQVF